MRTVLAILIFVMSLYFGAVRACAAQPPVIYPQLGYTKGPIGTGGLVFSDDGNLLAAINGEKTITIWETATGREVQTIAAAAHSQEIRCLALFPDNLRVISGSFDKTAVVWDIATGRSLFRLTGHTDGLRNIVVSGDGKLIATSDGKTARIWDSATGERVAAIPAPILADEYVPQGFESSIRSLAISPDASKLVIVTMRGIFVYDLHLKQMLSSVPAMKIGIYNTSDILGFSDNNEVILEGITFVSLSTLQVTRTFTKKDVRFSYISPDGSFLVGYPFGFNTTDKLLKAFDAKTMRERLAYNSEFNSYAIGYSKKTHVAAVTDFSGHLKLYDLNTGKKLQDLSTQAFVPKAGSFSPDATKVALTFSLPDTTKNHDFYVKLWDLKTSATEGGYNNSEYYAEHKRLYSSSNPLDQEKALKMKRMDQDFIGAGWAGGGGYSDLDELNRCYYQVTWVAPPSILGLGSGGSPLVNIYRINEQDYQNYLRAMDTDSRNRLRTLIKQFKAHDQNVTVVAVSYKHGYIFTGSEDMTIHLFSYPGTKLIRTFRGHRGVIKSLTISPDGTKLLSQAEDYTTRLWDIASGKEIAQFINFIDGEWIAITPEGYYNASSNGDKYLNARIGNRVYGIENYREAFFRPDLVKIALAGGSLQGYRTLADVKQPPRVRIVQTPSTVTTEDFKLTLRLEDQGGGVGDVRLFLNGSAIVLDSSRSLKPVQKSSEGAVYRNYSVKLAPGSNEIRAIAFNADNSMQSNPVSHQVSAQFVSMRKPSLYALVIGIQEFRNPKLQLKHAVADARLLATALRKGAAGLFQKVHITALTTQDVTTSGSIIKALQSYKSINPDDLFILYIASHGTVDDGEYFLITSNVSALSSHRLKTDALSQVQLKELVANIPSTKKLIILDTCNAAALGDAMQVAMLTRGMSEETAIKVLSRAVGSTILSASTSVQEALEGYQGHGLFTWTLVQGLLGKADKGRTGFVRTSDLATYVEDEVPAISERVFKRVQQPSASMNGQSFPVSRVR